MIAILTNFTNYSIYKLVNLSTFRAISYFLITYIKSTSTLSSHGTEYYSVRADNKNMNNLLIDCKV